MGRFRKKSDEKDLPKWLGFRHFWHWQVEQRWVMSRLNPKAIRPGHLYENCNYHPMVCLRNDHGDLTGISLVNGQVGGCSVFHCGPFKMTVEQAEAAREKIIKELADA
jgi:hypothetical protein